jgi:pimeloyl-ACP methyl ester carboxylesterase
MDVILIPGFWLDGSSWDEVRSALDQAAHRVRALTLPGLSSADADRAGIRLRDHVDAVVAELAAMRDVEYVDLPTGHWPQFTKPAELGQAILAAVERR